VLVALIWPKICLILLLINSCNINILKKNKIEKNDCCYIVIYNNFFSMNNKIKHILGQYNATVLCKYQFPVCSQLFSVVRSLENVCVATFISTPSQMKTNQVRENSKMYFWTWWLNFKTGKTLYYVFLYSIVSIVRKNGNDIMFSAWINRRNLHSW
jgi:hypothetical protein